MNNYKLQTFESFVSDKVTSLIDELDSEISGSKMRIGPSMDKLPWAMEVVVYEYLKDRTMEANSTTNNVDLDEIVKKLEDNQKEIEEMAMHKLVEAGMGEDTVEDTYDVGYKVVKLKNYNLIARPISGERGIQKDIKKIGTGADQLANPKEELLDKEFRSARNRGRNIMRKHLNPKPINEPAQHRVHNIIRPHSISVRPVAKNI